MIEHFCKWLKLVPLPNYSNEGGATYAFLDKVLNRFGALEMLIDQGMKFQELCEKALIDHCTISWDHHEPNGLT
jgi:hypothetical protein